MKMIFYLMVIVMIALPCQLQSQAVSINNTGTPPDPSSMLDVSSTRQGVLIPRLKTAQRTGISKPANGLMVYDSSLSELFIYNELTASWKMIGESYWIKEPGIANIYTNNRANIRTGQDVSLTGDGYLMLGLKTGLNLVADPNEIQARNNGAISPLFLQSEGGKVHIGRSDDSKIEIENTSIQALYNGSPETLILQGSPSGKVRIGDGFDFAATTLHISTGIDAGLATNQSGYMMIGHSTGLNVVFDNNEILARNAGEAATLYLARDASKVQLGNGAEASGTKLHITSGFDVGLADNTSGYIMMGSQAGSNMVLDNNEIQARNNAAASNLYLQNGGGNVYIGDQSPFNSSHRLGVNGNLVVTGGLRVGNEVSPPGYKLAVDGRIICTELMVRLVPDWPDYVFSKKHKLTSLDELRQFISENNHLPGIPTANDIKANGLGLGEMQKLQMEKIEELTLYILDLHKQLKEIREENQQMKAIISQKQ